MTNARPHSHAGDKYLRIFLNMLLGYGYSTAAACRGRMANRLSRDGSAQNPFRGARTRAEPADSRAARQRGANIQIILVCYCGVS